jgi:hypothetical protein
MLNKILEKNFLLKMLNIYMIILILLIINKTSGKYKNNTCFVKNSKFLEEKANEMIRIYSHMKNLFSS